MPAPKTSNCYYIFEGKVYDLKDWIPVHPGGSMWFNHSYGRDLTTVVHSYHKNPLVLRQILAKYVTNIPVENVLQKGFNVPDFILPPGFDAAKDIMVFEWGKENSIFEKTKKYIQSKEMQ
jgi:cytochrome b involved in lipid metabolism